jgi:hypothetical protein
MDWQIATALGAAGGALVEAINLYARVIAWQEARHAARGKGKRVLPKLSAFVDPPADLLAALTRLALGALAGWVFHAQLIGPEAAVAVGAAAPAVLRQLGTFRIVQKVAQGDEEVALSGHPEQAGVVPASPERAPASGPSRQDGHDHVHQREAIE